MSNGAATGDMSATSGYVYILRCSFGYKIGFSRHLEQRLAQLSNKMDFAVEHVICCDLAARLERALHRQFKAKRFEAWQTTEMFRLEESDLQAIYATESFDGQPCHHFSDEWQAVAHRNPPSGELTEAIAQVRLLKDRHGDQWLQHVHEVLFAKGATE